MPKWRSLVSEEVLAKLNMFLPVFLDDLERKIPVPEECPTRDCRGVLGDWISLALVREHLSAEEFLMIRDELGLQAELPKVHIKEE